MRVLVEVSCEIDPSLNVRIDRATGSALAEPGDCLSRVSLLGRVSVEAALALPHVSVTAFALGQGHDEALRHAIAAGASRAVELINGKTPGSSPSVALVAEWVRRQGPDIVLMDRSAGRLAARLGWAHLANVDSDLNVLGPLLTTVRHLGRGDREEVEAMLPAVLRLSDSLHPRYLARARLDAVRQWPIEIETLDGSPGTSPAVEAGLLQAARARTRLNAAPMTALAPTAIKASDRLAALMGGNASVAKPVERTPEKTVSTTDELAESFVRYLRHHELLVEGK